MADEGVNEKRCGRCGETKPLDQYGDSRHSVDGTQGYCRPCKSAYNLERYHRTKGSVRPWVRRGLGHHKLSGHFPEHK